MKIFLLVFSFLIFGCELKNNEWKNLIINNSLEGWHIFQDDGTKDGWYVENQILIFDAISDLESGKGCLLYTSPSPRDATLSRMPSSA